MYMQHPIHKSQRRHTRDISTKQECNQESIWGQEGEAETCARHFFHGDKYTKGDWE